MVTINIGRKEAVFFGVIILVFVGVAFGVAIGSDNWQIHGHDAGELNISGGINLVSSQVIGTTDVSATSSWADMPGMTVTQDSSGDFLLRFSASMYCPGNSNIEGDVRFLVDGVPHFTSHCSAGDGVAYTNLGMQWLEEDLSAGSHVFKVQWKNTGGTMSQKGVSYPRVFSVTNLG